MRRKISILFILLVFAAELSAQVNVDSLLARAKVTSGFERANVYYKLTLATYDRDLLKALEYASFALNELKTNEIKNDSCESGHLIPNVYNSIGVVYKNLGRWEKAEINFQEALTLYEYWKDSAGIALIRKDLGDVYLYQGKNEKALDSYQQALTISEASGNLKAIGTTMISLGLFFKECKSYKKSEDYYLKALSLYESTNDKRNVAIVNINLGSLHADLDSFDLALARFNKAYDIFVEIQNKRGQSVALNNIGSIFEVNGDLKNALKYYKLSLQMKTEMSDWAGVVRTKNAIGDVLLSENNFKEAESFFLDSYTMADSLGLLRECIENQKSLALLYEKWGRTDLALRHYKIFTVLKDSLMTVESMKQLNEVEAIYQTEKKEKEIELLEKDSELRNLELVAEKNRNERQRVQLLAVLSGLLFAIVLAFLFYKQYQNKKRANALLAIQNNQILLQKEEIQSQRDEIETQRDQVIEQRDIISNQKNDILSSIHYAHRIQSALIPHDQFLENTVSEYFVIYKPRDIVSGDFYWAKQTDNNLMIAVADCTGHGVPGAFMSMLGIAFLNDIASRPEIQSPAMILDEMRKMVVLSLNQKAKAEGKPDGTVLRDGMDFSLCIIEFDKGTLHFAGANNPMYLVRNGNPGEDKVLEEIPADRMPVGFYTENPPPFTFTSRAFSKGDSIYLCTDGFADQFGGKTGRKYLVKTLREKFLAIEHLPYNEQKIALEEEFSTWKGDRPQIDDVTLLGIRI